MWYFFQNNPRKKFQVQFDVQFRKKYIKGLVVSDEGADLIADSIGGEISASTRNAESLYHLRKEMVVVSTW